MIDPSFVRKRKRQYFCFQPAIKMTPVFLRKERAQKNHPKVVSISLVKAFKA
tara:strand:+ start:1180 stop:1335 length:156 start_codon:yes stop_codon:yes gene_type:complete